MKKTLAIFLIIVIMFNVSGCRRPAKSEQTQPETAQSEKVESAISTEKKGINANPEIATKYLNFIKYGFGEYGDVNFAEYYIYDVDKDGCEELIIKAGTCEADAVIWFCKYINREVQKIGDIAGGHSSLCGNSKAVGVTVHYGHQGVEWIDCVEIVNNSLKVDHIVPQREVDKYSEFDYCVEIKAYAINDMAFLIKCGGVDKQTATTSKVVKKDNTNTSKTNNTTSKKENKTEENYNYDFSYIHETPYFNITIPNYWTGNYYIEATENTSEEVIKLLGYVYKISFYEREAKESFDGGLLCTITLKCNFDEDDSVFSDKIGKLDRYYICYTEPTDVQFNNKTKKIYEKMYNDIPKMIKSMKSDKYQIKLY